MAAPKGHNGQGGGRPKGAPNKSTTRARQAIAEFVEGNADRLVGWLDRMAEESPKDAFNAFMAVVEYHIPKLSRAEVTGQDGKDLIPQPDANVIAAQVLAMLEESKPSH